MGILMDNEGYDGTIYEYSTEVIYDAFSGYANASMINQTLADYAKQGWRLHTALANDLGIAESAPVNEVTDANIKRSTGTTILIFERRKN